MNTALDSAFMHTSIQSWQEMKLDKSVIELRECGTTGVELITMFVLHTVFTVYLCVGDSKQETKPPVIAATDP